MKFATKVIHAGIEPDPSTGAIMTPIFQTSTYVQAAPGDHKGYEYARTQNPTRSVLEKNLAALENGTGAICFSSGLAAQDAVIKLLKAGDEVLSVNDLYGGSYRQMVRVYGPLGPEKPLCGHDRCRHGGSRHRPRYAPALDRNAYQPDAEHRGH
jgi:cystathionine gamma-lyase